MGTTYLLTVLPDLNIIDCLIQTQVPVQKQKEIGEEREGEQERERERTGERERERERARGREGEAMKKGRRRGLAENNRNLFSRSYGVPKSERKVSAGLCFHGSKEDYFP